MKRLLKLGIAIISLVVIILGMTKVDELSAPINSESQTVSHAKAKKKATKKKAPKKKSKPAKKKVTKKKNSKSNSQQRNFQPEYAVKQQDEVATPVRYRWKSSTIKYKLDTHSDYYRDIWQTAVDNWNQFNVIKLVKANGETPDVHLDASTAVRPEHSGLCTTTFYNQTRLNNLPLLKVATAIVYDNTCNDHKYSKSDRTRVAEHELGHAIGLGHSDSDHSIMNPTPVGRQITNNDVEAIKRAYAS